MQEMMAIYWPNRKNRTELSRFSSVRLLSLIGPVRFCKN